MPADQLAETAAALKHRHSALLAADSASEQTAAQRLAVERIEAARLRLVGDDRRGPGQMSLLKESHAGPARG